MALTAESISFAYQHGGRAVLRSVSLTLKAGARLGLIAPSGYGKTTLCKILAGYEQPDAGRVLLDGKPLAAYRGYAPVQLVWQHPELVLNPLLRLETSLQEGGRVSEELLRALGIQPAWRRRFPAELSGGELQRFCIARALAGPTRFLLADEMTTMLDLLTQADIWRTVLAETARRDIGLLVVSHSAGLIDRLCDDVKDLTTPYKRS